MVNKLLKAGRISLGLGVFLAGFYITFFDIYYAFTRSNYGAHLLHISVGFIFMLIGGYIMSPTIAEMIADSVVEHIPILDRLPGGRRKTDPPIEEEKEEKDVPEVEGE